MLMYRLIRQRNLLNRHATLAVYVDAWDAFKMFFSGLVGTGSD